MLIASHPFAAVRPQPQTSSPAFGQARSAGNSAGLMMELAVQMMALQASMQMLESLLGNGSWGVPLGQGMPAFGTSPSLGVSTPSHTFSQFSGFAPSGFRATNSPSPRPKNRSGSSPAQRPRPKAAAATKPSTNYTGDIKGLTFDKAAQLVRQGGGKVNPNGKPTVLALRSRPSASRTYKDTYVVLKPDKSIETFQGSTTPTTSGRGKAMLKPGAYQISPRWRDGKFHNDAFLVKSGSGSLSVGVARDSNGDGVYSRNEMNANTSSSQIRLHRGAGANRTSSTGCLNVRDYDNFLDSVGGRNSSFNLVLVNHK